MFGFIYHIAKETGWTKEYILNELSFLEINLMMADMPRLIRKPKKETVNSIANWLMKQ